MLIIATLLDREIELVWAIDGISQSDRLYVMPQTTLDIGHGTAKRFISWFDAGCVWGISYPNDDLGIQLLPSWGAVSLATDVPEQGKKTW